MAHVWPSLKAKGLSRVQELTKIATLDDLEKIVGKDAVKLQFEIEKHLALEMSLLQLTDCWVNCQKYIRNVKIYFIYLI